MGVVANAGELDEKSSLKGAHFVRLCSLRNIPLVFLVNTPSDIEFLSSHGSPGTIAKARSQMMATVATSSVAKFTVVCGGSYGPSAYAMVCAVSNGKTVHLTIIACSVVEPCNHTSCSLGHMQGWEWHLSRTCRDCRVVMVIWSGRLMNILPRLCCMMESSCPVKQERYYIAP